MNGKDVSVKEADRQVFRSGLDDGLVDIFLSSFVLMWAVAPYLNLYSGQVWCCPQKEADRFYLNHAGAQRDIHAVGNCGFFPVDGYRLDTNDALCPDAAGQLQFSGLFPGCDPILYLRHPPGRRFLCG